MSENLNGNSVNGKSKECPSHVKYNALAECPAALEADFVYPDSPSRCTWDRNKNDQQSPHTKRPL